jgi:Putative peptidoglycan binding domain
VPRKPRDDDEMPRRRRGRAAAVETERGFAMRMLLHSPKDMVAGLLAFAACSAIVANALFLQTGQHPSPMFGTSVHLGASSPLPRPRPVEAGAAVSEPRLAEPRLAEPRLAETRLAETRLAEPRLLEPRPNDPLANIIKATAGSPLSPTPMVAAPQPNVVRPPAPIPAPVQITGSRRVAAVQRALSENGYGQLRATGATGTIGADTQAAIQKFERERHMVVTGQVSDRLVKELTIVTGHPID